MTTLARKPLFGTCIKRGDLFLDENIFLTFLTLGAGTSSLLVTASESSMKANLEVEEAKMRILI